MALTNLIRNVVVVGSLTLPVYGCGDDVTNNNTYEGNGGNGGTGGSSNGSQAFCEDICPEKGCSGDVVKGKRGESCVDECVRRLSECSSSVVDAVYNCRRNHPCDDGPNGEPNWNDCLSSTPVSACYLPE